MDVTYGDLNWTWIILAGLSAGFMAYCLLNMFYSNFRRNADRIMWILIVLFLGPVGCVFYLIFRKRYVIPDEK